MKTLALITLLALETPYGDTVTQILPDITITALKEQSALEHIPSASSSITMESMKKAGTYRPKDLSSIIPGLHIPDYGASLTSTIYVRGMGSRMENPVIGLYIDGIPLLDKNSYDFDWEGMNSATMLHGPQGTLYGRNSMGGVLSLTTLSPIDGSSPTFNIEYGTARSLRAGASFTTGNHALSTTYRHTDGYYRNTFKDNNCDPYNGLSFRWKWERHTGERLITSNLLMANISREGGFAYGLYKDGVQHPVSYNDESSYKRLSVIEGFRMRYNGNSAITNATVSFQLLADDMYMDQDYTERSVFTLRQKQLSGAGTMEITIGRASANATWKPQTGVFSFFKSNHLEAPVTFKRDGIETLILGNANSHIPKDIGYLIISDNEMPINSDFRINTWNAALFHESVFDLDKWQLTAGIRLDFEGGNMNYDCISDMHYRFAPIMVTYRELSVPYQGNISHQSVEIIPKFSVLFKASNAAIIYSNISKGFRAGGFNTQIFSDILQNITMNAMMQDLGVYMDRPFVSVSALNTAYNPETAWNMELGARLHKESLNASVALYRTSISNQQLTVFPPGMSTGRMMTNAGQSRSMGIETEFGWNSHNLRSHLSWSWCNARFVSFNDGNNDYSGNSIPYIPEHTLYMSIGYSIGIKDMTLDIDASINGTGPYNWDESGTQKEPFKIKANGRIALVSGKLEIYLRAYNMTNIQSRSFYFKSMGNEFFAMDKPRIIVTGITFKL